MWATTVGKGTRIRKVTLKSFIRKKVFRLRIPRLLEPDTVVLALFFINPKYMLTFLNSDSRRSELVISNGHFVFCDRLITRPEH